MQRIKAHASALLVLSLAIPHSPSPSQNPLSQNPVRFNTQAVSESLSWFVEPLSATDGVAARRARINGNGNGQSHGLWGPLMEDGERHRQSPFYQLKIGDHNTQPEGTYQYLKEGDVTVAAFKPRSFFSDTPGIYLNTGGVVELFFIIRDLICLEKSKSLPHGLYWVSGQIAKRFVDAGYAVWHVTGADIEDPGATHRATLQDVAEWRVGAIHRRMRLESNLPESHPLFLVCASMGATEALYWLASGHLPYGQWRGGIFVNAALEFATGAANELRLEDYIKNWMWGANHFLPPLMPNGKSNGSFQRWMQNGLREHVDGKRTPVVFLGTIAPKDTRRAASFIEQKLAERYGTPDTDWVVNPLLARGLGPDGHALIPNSVSIMVSNIDHFSTRHHELINEIQAVLLKLMIRGGEFRNTKILVDGVSHGKLGDYSPEYPLMLQGYTEPRDHVIRFGNADAIGRWVRRFYPTRFLGIAPSRSALQTSA